MAGWAHVSGLASHGAQTAPVTDEIAKPWEYELGDAESHLKESALTEDETKWWAEQRWRETLSDNIVKHDSQPRTSLNFSFRRDSEFPPFLEPLGGGFLSLTNKRAHGLWSLLSQLPERNTPSLPRLRCFFWKGFLLPSLSSCYIPTVAFPKMGFTCAVCFLFLR